MLLLFNPNESLDCGLQWWHGWGLLQGSQSSPESQLCNMARNWSFMQINRIIEIWQGRLYQPRESSPSSVESTWDEDGYQHFSIYLSALYPSPDDESIRFGIVLKLIWIVIRIQSTAPSTALDEGCFIPSLVLLRIEQRQGRNPLGLSSLHC